MQFPFTFTFNMPGLHNPFLASPGAAVPNSRMEGADFSRQIASLRPARFPLISTLSPPVPLARKRGWIPSEPEPSHAATSATSTIGYLDTPAKYRDMPLRESERDTEDMIAELPPAKRRRTLAGSIMSTALSAALIGTAVGLTVYRLWRDRGKQPEHFPPPPPYQRGDWAPDIPEPVANMSPTKTRRPRPTTSYVRRSMGRPHHRKPRSKWQTITPPRSASPVNSPRSELDYVHVRHHSDDVEPDPDPEADQMDWIGDRLSHLIQEGQKALGREIVVMSEVKEDEVDDGSDGWEEEQEVETDRPGGAVSSTVSRGGSIRSLHLTHKPRDRALPPPYLPSPPRGASPRKCHFDYDSVHLSHRLSTPRRIARGTAVEADGFTPIASSYKEDESAWQSPELRESMERARARYSQRRVQ